MTKKQRKGVQLIIGATLINVRASEERDAGINWLMRQLTLDEKRRKPRGKYKR